MQYARSLSARRAWIEITSQVPTWFGMPSLSARRAWIEMGITRASIWLWVVALRKESVDRNTTCRICRQHVIVALRKESVDRNPIAAFLLMWYQWSLSARRAWIEIRPSY